MSRLVATSPSEIHSRHGCAKSVSNATNLPDLAAWEAITIVPDVDVPIGQSLVENFDKVRGGYEIEEVYVRPVGDGCAYEPLRADHLSQVGRWVMVARRRHPHDDVRVVGIMLAKDEADVIPNVVASLVPSLSRLYFYAFDEATKAAILSVAPPGWAVTLPAIEGVPRDGCRQALLEAVRADRGTDPHPCPTWVMVVQGDEVYADDLLHHVRLAQRERATVMTCQVATFVLHKSQSEGWDWSRPLDTRLTHYVWDFGEHAGFLDFPWVHYRSEEHMRAFPHGLYPARYARARPVRKHYPFRTPEQAQARIEDRIKSGWQPHYENYRQIFMDGEAAGRKVVPYWGWFPEAERVEGIW